MLAIVTRLTTSFFAALLAFGFCTAASAMPLLTTSATVCPAWGEPCEGQFFISNPFAEVQQIFQSNSQLNGQTITSIADAAARANADFGELGVFASASLTDYRASAFESDVGAAIAAGAVAGFFDTYTIFGGSGDGILQFNMTVDGTYTNSDPDISPFPEVGASLSAFEGLGPLGPSDPIVLIDGFAIPSSGTTSGTLLVPIEFGVPIDILIWMSGSIVLFDANFPDPYQFSGTVDFENTAIVSTLLITDALGNPIPGAIVSAGSGTQYPLSPLNANAIPEPVTFALLGLGLAGLGFARSRRNA